MGLQQVDDKRREDKKEVDNFKYIGAVINRMQTVNKAYYRCKKIGKLDMA